MKKKIALICLSAAAIILEILPFGAVTVITEGIEDIYKTYSYFSLVPVNNGIYGPFIVAIASCALLVLSAVYYFKTKKSLETAIAFISLITFVASVATLFKGLDYFTVVGGIVSAVLLANFIASMAKTKHKWEEQ